MPHHLIGNVLPIPNIQCICFIIVNGFNSFVATCIGSSTRSKGVSFVTTWIGSLIETLTLTWLFAIPRVVSFVATWSGSYCHLLKSFFIVSMASKPWDHFKLLKGGILHLTHTHLTIKQKTIKQNKTNTHTQNIKTKEGLKEKGLPYCLKLSLLCLLVFLYCPCLHPLSPKTHSHIHFLS